MKRLLPIALLAACSDPAPTEITRGRVTARIYSEPAQVAILVDDRLVWASQRGGDFVQTAALDAPIEMQFGSFKIDEAATPWRGLDGISAIEETDTGATFALAGGAATGTITLTDTDVRIQIAADGAGKTALAARCTTGEHFVGLGGQSFDVDHRGQHVPLWVQEDGIGKLPDPDNDYSGIWALHGRRHSTHTPMPMLLSSSGYALAVDTDTHATFDLCAARPDTARFETWSDGIDLHVFIGDPAAPQVALGHMLAWVGKPERPPLSAFFPWVDAIFGQDNVARVAAKLRTEGVAASAIWTEDWRGGADSSTGYALKENWRVDPTLYPDLAGLASDLEAQGFALLTYHNTFLDETADVYGEALAAGYSIHTQSGDPYQFIGVKFSQSTMLDLTNPAAVTWAKSVMGEGLALGVDGWMADFAEWLPTDAKLASGLDPIRGHQLYPVQWAQLNAELLGPDQLYFMRSAWLHSQPHVQILWPGDQQTDFSEGDGMASVIPMGIGLGLTGFPYFGSDIAGYMSQDTVPTDEELFYRWTTFGALQPIMRTHHGRSARQNFQWEHDAASIAHFRQWTRFHAQLAAYLWGSIGSFERDGLPLIRLVALAHPDEAWAWSILDEYELGDRLLVAPIQVAGATSREVRLPAGSWVPLFGGAATEGTITATADKTQIPVFAPAGAILVLYPDGVVTPLPTAPSDDREVWLYPGAAANPAVETWNDAQGAAGTPEWTWRGRPAGTGAPTAATFGGAPVTITDGVAVVTGDGTLEVAGGGTLVIARGKPAAKTTIRFR